MKTRTSKQSNTGTSALSLVVIVAFCGCVSPSPDPHEQAMVLPMAPQSNERYQCGPSTMASVLAFHGAAITEETIAKAIYSPTAKGVLLQDMAWYARARDFQAELRTGNVDDLKQAVDDRQPPIVLLDLGIAGYHKAHFTAITGISDEGVFQLGNNRAEDYVRMELFTRQWKRAGNQYLIITPAASQPH